MYEKLYHSATDTFQEVEKTSSESAARERKYRFFIPKMKKSEFGPVARFAPRKWVFRHRSQRTFLAQELGWRES